VELVPGPNWSFWHPRHDRGAHSSHLVLKEIRMKVTESFPDLGCRILDAGWRRPSVAAAGAGRECWHGAENSESVRGLRCGSRAPDRGLPGLKGQTAHIGSGQRPGPPAGALLDQAEILFRMGHRRAGSTFTLRLQSQSPSSRTPRSWWFAGSSRGSLAARASDLSHATAAALAPGACVGEPRDVRELTHAVHRLVGIRSPAAVGRGQVLSAAEAASGALTITASQATV